MSRAAPDPSPSSRSHFRSQPRRPATILELADKAREISWEGNTTLKHWLKAAEKHRNAGNTHVDRGEIEFGFVELARAATIVMEKVPAHKDYSTMLNASHRKNLGTVRFFPHPIIYQSLPNPSLTYSIRTGKISWIN